MSLVVKQSGMLSLVQDAGRPGRGHLGVSTSGAFDRPALRQVNALLGNAPGAAVVEVVGGGLELLAGHDHVIAVTGGVGPITIDGDPVAYGRAMPLRAGQLLGVGVVVGGLRAYVGVAGGIDVPHVLGSASTDTLSGLGPAALAVGDRLVVGTPRRAPGLEDVPALGRDGDLSLDVVLGPRDDWFDPGTVRVLLETPWQVSPTSDRVGIRLSGPPLGRVRTEELPSEPCLRGSIQVTAEGQPIVLGPDHPVTGGYPVIAVVVDADTDRLAQARPGQVVRLRRVSRP